MYFFSGTLVVKPHPHYQSVHGSQTSAPVTVSPSFSPAYNSPPGSFPDIEPRRSPYDFCNSPCPSVVSSASDPYSYIPSRASSERTVSDIDGSAKPPYTKNNSKRIYIPTVKTRGNSGSVEVGKVTRTVPWLVYFNFLKAIIILLGCVWSLTEVTCSVAARTSPTSPSYSEEPITSTESLHHRRRK